MQSVASPAMPEDPLTAAAHPRTSSPDRPSHPPGSAARRRSSLPRPEAWRPGAPVAGCQGWRARARRRDVEQVLVAVHAGTSSPLSRASFCRDLDALTGMAAGGVFLPAQGFPAASLPSQCSTRRNSCQPPIRRGSQRSMGRGRRSASKARAASGQTGCRRSQCRPARSWSASASGDLRAWAWCASVTRSSALRSSSCCCRLASASRCGRCILQEWLEPAYSPVSSPARSRPSSATLLLNSPPGFCSRARATDSSQAPAPSSSTASTPRACRR